MLGSGSNGNAILVECDGSRLLFDCGFGTRTLAGRLKAINIAPESIEGCLITHEHHDHIRGAGAAAKRWGWGIYATRGTAKARELLDAPVQLFVAGMTSEFPRMRVMTTRTPHDADESVGFVVESRSTGARAGLFYDIGHVTRGIAVTLLTSSRASTRFWSRSWAPTSTRISIPISFPTAAHRPSRPPCTTRCDSRSGKSPSP